MNDAEHKIDVRVYFADTDAGGVAHHATFVRWLELARSEWVHAHGSSIEAWAHEGVVFVVASLALKYEAPAHLDDTLTIVSRVAKARNASLSFAQRILRDRQPICTAQVDLVCVDIKSKKPVRIPAKLRLDARN